MLELIIIAFIFWLGYNAGQMVLSWQLRDIIRAEARKEGIKVDDEYNVLEDKKPKVQQLIVEKVNNILYLYERDTDDFVCQGSTLTELATLAKKYKNIKYAAVMIDEEIYAFVDGVVKTDKEVLKNES
jgi:hypothetical protein